MFQHAPSWVEGWRKGTPQSADSPSTEIQVQPAFALCHRYCSSQAGFLGFGQPAIS